MSRLAESGLIGAVGIVIITFSVYMLRSEPAFDRHFERLNASRLYKSLPRAARWRAWRVSFATGFAFGCLWLLAALLVLTAGH